VLKLYRMDRREVVCLHITWRAKQNTQHAVQHGAVIACSITCLLSLESACSL
jgi:hypothetical protein